MQAQFVFVFCVYYRLTNSLPAEQTNLIQFHQLFEAISENCTILLVSDQLLSKNLHENKSPFVLLERNFARYVALHLANRNKLAWEVNTVGRLNCKLTVIHLPRFWTYSCPTCPVSDKFTDALRAFFNPSCDFLKTNHRIALLPINDQLQLGKIFAESSDRFQIVEKILWESFIFVFSIANQIKVCNQVGYTSAVSTFDCTTWNIKSIKLSVLEYKRVFPQ